MGLQAGLQMGLQAGLLLTWSKGGRPLRPFCGTSSSIATVRRTTWRTTVNASDPATSAEPGVPAPQSWRLRPPVGP